MDPILHSLVPFHEFKTTPLSSQPPYSLSTPLPLSLHSHIIHVNHLCKEEQYCHHVSEGERGSLMKRTSHASSTISNPLISLVEWWMEQTHSSHSLLHLCHSEETAFTGIEISFTYSLLLFHLTLSTLLLSSRHSISDFSYQTLSLSWTGCIDWSGMVCCGVDGMGCL